MKHTTGMAEVKKKEKQVSWDADWGKNYTKYSAMFIPKATSIWVSLL